MKILSAADVDVALDDLALIDRLDELFRAGCEMPTRHHHPIKEPLGPHSADAMLLLMPAWTRGPSGRIGVKVVTVFPDNGKRSLPSIYGQYLLLDGTTGATLALLDGTMLTKRRTACASGLASRYLSRTDAARLLMIGTGALAPELIRVHAKVRPIREVAIWGRTPAHAETLAEGLAQSLPMALGRPITVRAITDRRAAVADADIVSCATLSKAPLVEGAWLREGQHLDLVGAYTPQMRESDDNAVWRARVYVDTRAGALKEGGDIVQPLANGTIEDDDVIGDLFELTRGQQTGRLPGDATSITLFKSVGAALEDLAAAELAVEA
ncbi:ornithine cyclodeaminase family protein [Reyranella sp.]|uniref:ornithine cyclodeaminase family protein n=1 Tax=Reyranella sp. TaxID=1929291 RepID=UPI0012104110|nr:ornithine cyclodeaminase family protein [Reyranella sp.]TAJ86664.1 MAG: ornithine cyclodeaminase family protein [Reyranella sp.]